MAKRDSKFMHQVNTRSSWVRMTSAVNYEGSDELARKYILQGGTLNEGALRSGIGSTGGAAYDRLSPGGQPNRMGIRPMPGITNVDIQTKGAYGSLQEATVSFTAWDIRQLEELELLYMRPGYTVLLEFGWNYAIDSEHFNRIPQYDIFNKTKEVSLNKMFEEIYTMISESKGTYDALIGYVENYNWTAREDGGYNCTTSIISLGEVLESLKCNAVPLASTAFNVNGGGILKQGTDENILKSYEQGIIPGMLHEMWEYMNSNITSKSYAGKIKDPKYGNSYDLYMSKAMKAAGKNDRGGYAKPLGKDDDGTECWITLGSLCDLFTNYITLKDEKDNPLAPITAYQTNDYGAVIMENGARKPLECIASPLAISTNLGVCFVRNNNWTTLGTKLAKSEEKEDKKSTSSQESELPNAVIQEVIKDKNLKAAAKKLIRPQFSTNMGSATFKGDIIKILRGIAGELLKGVIKSEVVETGNGFKTKFTFFNENSFTSNNDSPKYINFFDYFYKDNGEKVLEDLLFLDPFGVNYLFDSYRSFVDSTGTQWTKELILKKAQDIFSKHPLNSKLQQQTQKQLGPIMDLVGDEAKIADALFSGAAEFLVPQTSNSSKALGRIPNIYVNINYLYSQAISKNVASTDNQNSNNIAIRAYIQTILRDIQNSLGNINEFDLQVDNRSATGRIIDLNFTGNADIVPFMFQLQNTESIVRKYNFQSKIFPEMGAMIAISAQDATGIGKLGYDNATLVAWNAGITDRLLPKKDFSQAIQSDEMKDPTSFILPFLTKMYTYFSVISGNGVDKDKDGSIDNINYAFGGLDFAYRDFLANMSRLDERNNFKAIIPTELSLTIDGIGGLVIGNLFQINQDIVPKGYRSSMSGRLLAYIVVKLNHTLSGNDWTTEIGAYPIILEKKEGTDVIKKWNNNEYPKDTIKGPTIKMGEQIISSVDRARLNALKGDYLERAYALISFEEGFSVTAYWDVNAWRSGYGTDHKMQSDGKLVQVNKDTTFTQEEAKATLLYDIKYRFESGVVSQIGKENWDKLNDNQKASLLSYAYNGGAGALKTYGVASSIKGQDYTSAALNIARGPITSAGKVLPVLQRRRLKESILFGMEVLNA